MSRQLVLWKLPVGSEIPARPYHGKESGLAATTDEDTICARWGGNPGAPGRAEGLKEEEEQEQGLVTTIP